MKNVNYKYSAITREGDEFVEKCLPCGTLIVTEDNAISTLTKFEDKEVEQILVTISFNDSFKGKQLFFNTRTKKVETTRLDDKSVELIIERGTDNGDIISLEFENTNYLFLITVESSETYVVCNKVLYTSVFTQRDGNYQITLPTGETKNFHYDNATEDSLVVFKGCGQYDKTKQKTGDLHVTFLVYRHLQIFNTLTEYYSYAEMRAKKEITKRSPPVYVKLPTQFRATTFPVLLEEQIVDTNNVSIPLKKVFLIPQTHDGAIICYMSDNEKKGDTLFGV
ncbi:hypothetical protein EIN_379590 [Entamoeba invadens IP1]|uniref:Uncharacterized protein n=1 Tax=Entamoeba invadens IP1 TaxID=370355 RepID=A0A0A1UAL0_ENTIV|nr:hypothetical protein EIN_379590 [Entamoeba invadens IP1]ELP92082.1 hypothetical protein EIN_379590 [Entamoeba invadens IP1]|eukprot:XP_004258853.1 hypothetical protein EIN_379590 [Entamoeba invadens IP1]